MLALWVKVRVKPQHRRRFLEAIEVDALASERDEPGCMRFKDLLVAITNCPQVHNSGNAGKPTPVRVVVREPVEAC